MFIVDIANKMSQNTLQHIKGSKRLEKNTTTCFMENKHVTSSVSCAGVFGNIFLLITSFVIAN